MFQIVNNNSILPAKRRSQSAPSNANSKMYPLQIATNRLRLSFEKKNVVLEARECKEIFEFSASRKGLELKMISYLSPTNEMLTTDHIRLKQIILNLLHNAIKFTSSGSVKLILKEIKFNQNSSNPAEGVRVICQDTGIGIRDYNQRKLITSMERLEEHDHIPLGAQGVGKGLIISNRLAKG